MVVNARESSTNHLAVLILKKGTLLLGNSSTAVKHSHMHQHQRKGRSKQSRQ
jgi:hypothetical protein